MTDKYGVFGNPVEHSRSPDIHHYFARQTNQDMTYDRHLVPLGQFVGAADEFFKSGGKGLNVTVPFKVDAHDYADTLTERARRAGAVNTLALSTDDTVLGDNTDGVGMVTDIRDNLGWRIEGQRILILGAGGAVRGVLEPLLAEGPKSVTIANRTESKAVSLASRFSDLGAIYGCGFADLQGPFDLIINGTSASLSDELPPLPDEVIGQPTCCYDMMYAAEPTVFLSWGVAKGAGAIADGLGMLVEQAAESFRLWRGVSPRTAEVIGVLREDLG